ncbi:MAG: hypothetical protein ACTJHU_12000 [Mycetocola sp.]
MRDRVLIPLTAVSAETIKLRTLPGIVVTALGTVGASIALAAAIARSSAAPALAADVTAQTVPFLQIGLILCGVLTVSTEYQSGQHRTTLTAMPRRWSTLAAKALAFACAAALTSASAVGSGWLTATIIRGLHPLGGADDPLWPVVGSVIYLTLMGMLAFALAVLMRSLVAPLVTMLSLVLIVSPLADGLTELAHWLPDRAGQLLYLDGTGTVLTAGTGALVLCGWITLTAGAALLTFVRRDA